MANSHFHSLEGDEYWHVRCNTKRQDDQMNTLVGGS